MRSLKPVKQNPWIHATNWILARPHLIILGILFSLILGWTVLVAMTGYVSMEGHYP